MISSISAIAPASLVTHAVYIERAAAAVDVAGDDLGDLFQRPR